MSTTTLTPGAACECVSKEQDPNRYDAWVVRFRNPITGDVLEFKSTDEPPVQPGRHYRLEVNPVPQGW